MKKQAGFTLVELLLAITISGIITAALSAAFIAGFKTADATEERVSESHDAQITAAYFAKDVASSDVVSVSDTACAGATPIISMQHSDQGTIKSVAYYVATASGSVRPGIRKGTFTARRLMRRTCTTDPASGAVTITSTITVVHGLAASDPVSACTPACPASGTSSPRTITLSVTESSSYSYSYNYVLTGNRRPT